jgi:aldehyde dehydrogenase (NAD+)
MQDFLKELGIKEVNSGACYGKWIEKPTGGELVSISPIDGKPIATILQAGEEDYERVVTAAEKAFQTWRMLPAPKRGEIVRQLGVELRKHTEALGKLVTLEMGKILPEGIGEVQEMIDICDFATGLSRQLYGLSMHSERPAHRMYEQWHPLGIVGIISAFNFPVAVWSWNAAIAAACGDTMVWKPSSQTPLTGIAVQNICNKVMERNGLEGIFCLTVGGGRKVGERMIADKRIPLISATGSTSMGIRIAEVVAKRLGSTILELGGNNAIIATEGANLDLVTRAVLFGAVGTAGQRCTTTRRLLLHKPIAAEVTKRLIESYKQITIGDPLKEGILMGPMVNRAGVDDMMAAMKIIREQGGEVLYGGEELKDMPSDCYVQPTIVKAPPDMPIVQDETFAPILYIIEADTVEELIRLQNDVPQGLSSAMFTNHLLYAERFLSHEGSDCGIANINIGTSGAEIGGAFGGEKETGGGREAGSDAWKAYMRRQTVTVNWSTELPLAQGIKFG